MRYDEMIVIGHLWNEWKLSDASDHLFTSRCLIKMIVTCFLNEYVHLINVNSTSHWKCKAFEINHARLDCCVYNKTAGKKEDFAVSLHGTLHCQTKE